MIKAICIDVDNTLIDFNKCAEVCVRKCFEDLKLDYDLKIFETFRTENNKIWLALERGEITRDYLFDNRWNIIFDKLGIIGQDGLVCEKMFRAYISDTSIPVDGAPEMMEYISQRYPIYLMTNGFLQQQVHRLAKIDFLKYVTGIFASLEIGYNKPEKGFYEHCFSHMPYKPEECLMIGDSLSSDVKGALNSGMHSLWFNYDKREDYRGAGFDYMVDSLYEVPKIIASILDEKR